MKKINLKGLTPSSITTVVVLLIALINAILQIFGKTYNLFRMI